MIHVTHYLCTYITYIHIICISMLYINMCILYIYMPLKFPSKIHMFIIHRLTQLAVRIGEVGRRGQRTTPEMEVSETTTRVCCLGLYVPACAWGLCPEISCIQGTFLRADQSPRKGLFIIFVFIYLLHSSKSVSYYSIPFQGTSVDSLLHAYVSGCQKNFCHLHNS